MYAIVETGGKQYRCEPERVIEVEKIDSVVGEEIVLDKVLLIGEDGDIKAGSPYVEGAKVVCQLLAQGKDKKLDVFNYKAKKNVRKKNGHRQLISRLKVQEIVSGA